MGVTDKAARSSLRFSLSRYNTKAEVIHAAEKIRQIVLKMRAL
jgi:cysteine sulfinate desulfinase/cysteine desulfurase-like protein